MNGEALETAMDIVREYLRQNKTLTIVDEKDCNEYDFKIRFRYIKLVEGNIVIARMIVGWSRPFSEKELQGIISGLTDESFSKLYWFHGQDIEDSYKQIMGALA